MITLPLSTATPSDRELQHRVALFIQQRKLSTGARLTVLARRGVVTLGGIVPTFHQRQLLHSLVRHVAGVALVQDELEVAAAGDESLMPEKLQLVLAVR